MPGSLQKGPFACQEMTVVECCDASDSIFSKSWIRMSNLPTLFCCSCCFHHNSDCQAKSGENMENVAKHEFTVYVCKENKQHSQICYYRHCKQWSLPSTSPQRIAQCYYLVQTLNNYYCFVLNELAPDITATFIIITCLTLCKNYRETGWDWLDIANCVQKAMVLFFGRKSTSECVSQKKKKKMKMGAAFWDGNAVGNNCSWDLVAQ